MLKWAAVFLVVSLVAAVLGFGMLAGILAELFKVLFFLCTILFVASVLSGLVNQPYDGSVGGKPPAV